MGSCSWLKDSWNEMKTLRLERVSKASEVGRPLIRFAKQGVRVKVLFRWQLTKFSRAPRLIEDTFRLSEWLDLLARDELWLGKLKLEDRGKSLEGRCLNLMEQARPVSLTAWLVLD